MIGLSFICKNSKDGSAVVFELKEVRMLLEVMVRVVFHNEPAIVFQQFVVKNEIRNFGEIWERIRRTGKNEVVLLGAVLHVFEHIHGEHAHAGETEFFSRFFDEVSAFRKLLHDSNIGAASGRHFVADAAGAAKEIEKLNRFEIEIVVEHVEQSFLCKIRCGASWDILRWVKLTRFKLSSNDAHIID